MAPKTKLTIKLPAGIDWQIEWYTVPNRPDPERKAGVDPLIEEEAAEPETTPKPYRWNAAGCATGNAIC